MSELGLYLCRHTDYCAETRNLIEDVIRSISEQNDFLSIDAKKAILRDALQGMGFSDEQLEAFAKGKLPVEYKIVPVDVKIERYYRTYVRVPVCEKNEKNIREKVEAQIAEAQDLCLIPDTDLEIERDDIDVVAIDWEGEHYE